MKSLKNKLTTLHTGDLLQELSAVYGVSSDEKNIADKLKMYLDVFCDSTTMDSHGNLTGYIAANKADNAKTIIFEAHMDRIGLIVTNICDDGSLKFACVGGVDERILPFSEVIVLSDRIINGLIVPCNNDKDKGTNFERIYKTNELKIETGYESDILKKYVKIGDFVVLHSKYTHLCNNVVSGASFDNRAGISSILLAVNNINRDKLKYNIFILFSVQEELGLHGAYWAGKNILDDIAASVVIDMTHGETNDTKGQPEVFPLGCGAVICRGPNLHYTYTKQLIDLAERKKIPHRIEVASASSGTNAWALQTSSDGIPTMLVSIPLKYMHTNVETLMLDDIDAATVLLTNIAEGGVVL